MPKAAIIEAVNAPNSFFQCLFPHSISMPFWWLQLKHVVSCLVLHDFLDFPNLFLAFVGVPDGGIVVVLGCKFIRCLFAVKPSFRCAIAAPYAVRYAPKSLTHFSFSFLPFGCPCCRLCPGDASWPGRFLIEKDAPNTDAVLRTVLFIVLF